MIAHGNEMSFLKEKIFQSLYYIVSQETDESSLYVRGSVLDQNSNFKPWDIDLTLIAPNYKLDALQDIHKTCSKLKLEHLGDFYSLDFSFISHDQLKKSKNAILNIMLHQNSSLVWGDDVVSKTQIRYPNYIEIIDMKKSMKSIINKKINTIEEGFRDGMQRKEIYLRMRSIIKYIIRWHCLESMLEEKLMRQLNSCLDWIGTNKSVSLADECRLLIDLFDYEKFNINDTFNLIFILKKQIQLK